MRLEPEGGRRRMSPYPEARVRYALRHHCMLELIAACAEVPVAFATTVLAVLEAKGKARERAPGCWESVHG